MANWNQAPNLSFYTRSKALIRVYLHAFPVASGLTDWLVSAAALELRCSWDWLVMPEKINQICQFQNY
jgi:hypothetical protein